MLLAAVAKLNTYLGDPSYDRLSEEFKACQEEGLNDFELDLINISSDIIFDFMSALMALGYSVRYIEEEQLLEVSYE